MKTLSLLLALLLCASRLNASVATQNVGHFQIPTAPAAGTSVVSGAANTYTGTAVQLSASTSAIYITGVHVETSAALAATYISCQLMIGAGGAETAVGQYIVSPFSTGSTVAMGFHYINPPIAMANGSRLSVKMADSVGSKTYLVSVEAILQSNVVTGVTETTDVTKWNGTAVSSPATAGIPDVNVKNIDNDAASASGTVTFPNATLASTTNITAASGVALAALDSPVLESGTAQAGASGSITLRSGSSSVDSLYKGEIIEIYGGTGAGESNRISGYTGSDHVATVDFTWTGVNPDNTSLYRIKHVAPAITSAGAVTITATVPSTIAIASAIWKDTTASDFTTAASIGKSIMNGVALGTGLTINAYTGDTPQTGDSYARIGAAGAGLTALGDSRIANLDAAVTTRMATYTQPTGFLAATFPATVASTTNITAGTITTATTCTTCSALTTNNDKTGYSLSVTPPTAATIASAVWQDTTAGDFTTALSVGKSVMNGVTLGTGLTVNDITTKTGYSLSVTPPTAATIASAVWQDTTAGDFTTALSVGKSVMNGVSLGTGLTVNAVTGLTASNLDTTVSSRMATYTQPTGFLAATFPSGTVANTTNITAGTITTATNLTNLPSIPANWITATGITAGALNGKGDWNIGKTGYSLISAYDPAKTAAQDGDAMTLTAAYDAAKTAASQTSVNAIPTNPLTTLGTNAPAGWVNAAAVGAAALNGKGDWNIGKTGYSLTSAYDPAKIDIWNVTLPSTYTGQTAGHLLWKIGNKP